MQFSALALLLVAMLSIQSGASLAKSLFHQMTPEGITALRLLFAALILSIIWRPWRHRFTRADYKVLLAYGASLGMMNLLFYLSLARIPLGIAVAVEFLGPLSLALFHSRRLRDLIWIGCAAAGVALLLPQNNAEQALDLFGVFLAFAAGICWALYIVFGQKAGRSLHGGSAAALGMAFGTLFVLPFGFLTEGTELFRTSTLPLAIGVAILSSAIPYSLEMFALKRLPTKLFSILMSMEPAIAALSGFVFLREYLSISQWLAIGLVIVASVGCTFGLTKQSPPVEI